MAARRPGFPRTVIEFQRRFSTDEACELYLAECRWPDGFRCPRCGNEKAWALPARRLRECTACHYQASTTAGTILHRTRTPLLVWFWAAFLMIIDKRGVSALGIQRQLGIARYETAWMILHKLRRATVNLERTRLTGEVEVDETWVGGYQPGGEGRTRKGRRAALVVMALEVGNGYPERLRARLVPDDTSASLVGFVKDVVEPGSVIITDGFQSYRALAAAGYTHRRIVEGSGDAFTNPVPHLHQAIGNLKAWLNGTHRGVTRRHLAVYLDEFVFRHNRRLNLAAAFLDAARSRNRARPDDLRHHHRREGPADGLLHAVSEGGRAWHSQDSHSNWRAVPVGAPVKRTAALAVLMTVGLFVTAPHPDLAPRSRRPLAGPVLL